MKKDLIEPRWVRQSVGLFIVLLTIWQERLRTLKRRYLRINREALICVFKAFRVIMEIACSGPFVWNLHETALRDSQRGLWLRKGIVWNKKKSGTKKTVERIFFFFLKISLLLLNRQTAMLYQCEQQSRTVAHSYGWKSVCSSNLFTKKKKTRYVIRCDNKIRWTHNYFIVFFFFFVTLCKLFVSSTHSIW